MDSAKLRLTSMEALGSAAECLRLLAHPHRLRMIQMLIQGDFTVGELADACELPGAMASEHLRLMQRCGLLKSKKVGRCVFYQVTDPYLNAIIRCVETQHGVTTVTQHQNAV